MRAHWICAIVFVVLVGLVVSAICVHQFWWKKRVRLLTQRRGIYESVHVATTDNLDTVRVPGDVDGVPVEQGQRVAFFQQAQAVKNGVYQWQLGKWVRSTDLSSDASLNAGARIYVENGQRYAGQILVLELLPSGNNRDQYQGVCQPFVLVPFLDQLLGTTERRPGSLLVSNPKAFRGVEWRSPREVFPDKKPTRTDFTVEPNSKAFVPIKFGSRSGRLAKHDLVVLHKDRAYKVELVVTQNNGIVPMSGTKVPRWLQILTGAGTRKWNSEQSSREAVCAIENVGKEPMQGEIWCK